MIGDSFFDGKSKNNVAQKLELSVPYAPVDHMQQTLPAFASGNILRDDACRCLGPCGRRNVGGDGHRWVSPIGMIFWQGFDSKHIKCRLRHLPAIQCSEQSRIINQRPTPGVNHKCTLSQKAKGAPIQYIFCRSRLWQKQNHDLSIGQRINQPLIPV